MSQLRQRAESLLKRGTVVPDELSQYDEQHLYQELCTHHIELELQNDELCRTHKALQESRDRYADLYNSAPVGYVTLDKEGNIVEANARFANILNMATVELIERSLAEFIVDKDQDSFYLLQRRLSTTKDNQSCELRLRDAMGGQHWVRIDCNAMTEDGYIVQIRTSISDISSLKQTEKLLQQSRHALEKRILERTLELEQVRTKAEQACQSRSDSLTFLTRELRQPMNAIIESAHLLKTLTVSAQGEMAAAIATKGQHILSMIDDFLELSSLDSRIYQQDIQTLELSHVIQTCLSGFIPVAELKQIQIHDEITPLGSHFIKADSKSLTQVLNSLISNAVSYTQQGGIITLSCRNLQGIRIRLCVTDNGPGIAEAELENIFMPFNRLNKDSTGVGLTIARKLIEMTGGTMGVESTLGKGSTFWIELDNAV